MSEAIFIKIDPKNINFVNRIMEGYEYLGVVTTMNRIEGLLRIRVTPDTYDEVFDVLRHLSIKVEFIEGEPIDGIL